MLLPVGVGEVEKVLGGSGMGIVDQDVDSGREGKVSATGGGRGGGAGKSKRGRRGSRGLFASSASVSSSTAVTVSTQGVGGKVEEEEVHSASSGEVLGDPPRLGPSSSPQAIDDPWISVPSDHQAVVATLKSMLASSHCPMPVSTVPKDGSLGDDDTCSDPDRGAPNLKAVTPKSGQ